MYLLLTLFLFAITAPAHAQDMHVGLPVKCAPGADCWVVNYVDTDPEKKKAADFRCGPRTYDDHNGTDFAIPDLVAMEMGVDVIAAAPGKILRVRDGVEDKSVTEEERRQLLEKNQGCGNGVFIDHGNGWQTIYCHMKKDSIAVKPGQSVKQGDLLGKVGNSGIAEFPHLHFGIFKDNHNIDPFTGRSAADGCNGPVTSLWDSSLHMSYVPAIIAGAGFRSAAPDFESIRIDSSTPDILPVTGEALVFWTMIYGSAPGDIITLEITGPHGEPVARRDITQDRDRARQYYYVGKKRPGDAFSEGVYTGQVTLRRENVTPAFETEQTRTLVVR